MALWLDASTIDGVSDGGVLRVWPDRSGDTHHASQATGRHRPRFQRQAMNGRPAVRFDGVDDHLRIRGTLDLGNGARTVVFVARATIVGNRGIVDLGDGRTTGGAFMITPEYGVRLAGGQRLFAESPAGVAEIGVVTLAGGAPDSIAMAINGVALRPTSTENVPINTHGFGTVGAYSARPTNRYNFAGDIAEVLVYRRVLSAPEVEAVHAYLAAKYAIPLAGSAGTSSGLRRASQRWRSRRTLW